ncbi:unnamed protein product [Amaranthus hypochondriacus]
MVKKGKIALYRGRLDETLASDDLTDEKKLRTLVKHHILQSSDNKTSEYIDSITDKRTPEVSNFLEMLRSASENYNASSHETHHAAWKLKQDNEDFRVMYREGPVGSPFHSLLVEGYIDAPMDACLCVSWESALYPRWFPETLVPTFKVAEAKSLQKVRIGEEISLVRVKLSWPLSTREALLHYFEFEYLEGDLLVVLLNTIPDPDNIQMETHGFTNEGIPKADNTVRIDIVGGFALQKVTENRSYFRTIGNLDIKLDFVPPSLINFISRQLIGSGFRFYKKTVASVSNGDEDFSKALNDPLYSRIREAVYSNDNSEGNPKTQTIKDNEFINTEQKINAQSAFRNDDAKVDGNDHVNKFSIDCKQISNEIEEENVKESKEKVNGYLLKHKPASEIEEEDYKGSDNEIVNSKEDVKGGCDSNDQPRVVHNFHKDPSVPISPQVEKALGALDKMISVVKENRLKRQNCSQSGHNIAGGEALSTMGKLVKLVDTNGTLMEEIENGVTDDALRSEKTYFQTQEANSYVLTPEQNPPNGNSPLNLEANGIHENSKKTGQARKWRLCCFHLAPGRLVS